MEKYDQQSSVDLKLNVIKSKKNVETIMSYKMFKSFFMITNLFFIKFFFCNNEHFCVQMIFPPHFYNIELN